MKCSRTNRAKIKINRDVDDMHAQFAFGFFSLAESIAADNRRIGVSLPLFPLEPAIIIVKISEATRRVTSTANHEKRRAELFINNRA
jgi:hypothetical protein